MVQVMGNTVAFTALGKAGHQAGRMRYAVTTLTGWNCLMLVLMAGNTKDRFMFGVAVAEHFKRLLVAGCTHLVRCVRSHVNSCRHMGVMTFFTVGNNHIGAVWLMTLSTERFLTVYVVAEAARQSAMLALDLLQLGNL